MCIFSREVAHVANTKIFARDSGGQKQFLAYEMRFAAAEDLAMILPLPVPKQTPENGVRFINLEKFSNFFVQLESGFPQPRGRGVSISARDDSEKLKVADVGSFEASFVPTIADFARLDERFCLPKGTWDKLPTYKSYGFAVFKLKKDGLLSHPMAFEFPRANPKQLFFPTIHIHDGKVQKTVKFDHALYAQLPLYRLFLPRPWTESPQPAGMFMDINQCEGLVDKDAHVYQQMIEGVRKNDDIVV